MSRRKHPPKSEGHIAWLDNGTREAYMRDGEVYIAWADRPLDTRGYRLSGRWECSKPHWDHYYNAIFKSRVTR